MFNEPRYFADVHMIENARGGDSDSGPVTSLGKTETIRYGAD